MAIAWFLLASMGVEVARLQPPGAGAPGDAILQYFAVDEAPAVLRHFIATWRRQRRSSPDRCKLCRCRTDVGAYVSGDDAAFGCADDPHLLRDRGHGGEQGEHAVHPIILVAGYLTVWLAASLCFAALTLFVQRIGGGGLGPARSGSRHCPGGAGAYQFSRLKHACLKKCRNPFATLFAHWTTSRNGIFRLGVQQGIWCLGCCWALMLIMFAVGVMNIFWMALIGLFTLFERRPEEDWLVASAALYCLCGSGPAISLDLRRMRMAAESWAMKGELVLLQLHGILPLRPVTGRTSAHGRLLPDLRQASASTRAISVTSILSGLNLGLIMEIPAI
jgi:hypothetical protein